jgi:lysozyme
LWIANYVDPIPPIPKPWTGYTFWQYSETASRAGFPLQKHGDLNWFNGSMADLNKLAI